MNLAAVGLELLVAAVVHRPILYNLIFPRYQDHAAAGETWRLLGGRDRRRSIWQPEGRKRIN